MTYLCVFFLNPALHPPLRPDSQQIPFTFIYSGVVCIPTEILVNLVGDIFPRLRPPASLHGVQKTSQLNKN